MHHATRLFHAVVLLFVATPVLAASLPIPEPPNLEARSYILVDFDSGQVLAAKNAEKAIEPASITKLMTTYILFDEIDQGNIALDDKVTISEKAWQMGGSKMFIEVGEQVSVDDLLHGMITSSGNDATVALAEHVGGTESSFADYMNQYARDLGLTDSHFVDASGWPHEDHVMSAHDIARLLGAIVRDFPDLYDQYFHQKKFTYAGIEQYNRNSLLWSDDSVDGGKTGHTESAGYCLAATAKRDDMRLVSVVTGTDSNNARKSQSQALLNYGFRFYESSQLFDADKQISEIRVWKGDETMLPVVADGAVHVAYPRGKRDELSTSAELPSNLSAPVKDGERLGTLHVKYGDKTLAEVPLYAGQAIAEGGIIRRLTDEVMMMFE
ncbi:D-alanyl-D-alanine carboxypeptidase family protein [Salinisphaera orenii]|uniref:serine-type D-Ala-D-Ala carboxypeptidase n=1 Tax=Salinisphaera orenii YIM 95161 TaxID=1051139 RepID=A0A423PHY3_9GAMM|nr:D-alanyl-D-alanine carboxypeptidase family protein [Salinisphaera halophila]ROO25096.1 D-alanyl-D-alanine carboxypeptidase [Salinisphaera halophila YIM 95161]